MNKRLIIAAIVAALSAIAGSYGVIVGPAQQSAAVEIITKLSAGSDEQKHADP